MFHLHTVELCRISQLDWPEWIDSFQVSMSNRLSRWMGFSIYDALREYELEQERYFEARKTEYLHNLEIGQEVTP